MTEDDTFHELISAKERMNRKKLERPDSDDVCPVLKNPIVATDGEGTCELKL